MQGVWLSTLPAHRGRTWPCRDGQPLCRSPAALPTHPLPCFGNLLGPGGSEPSSPLPTAWGWGSRAHLPPRWVSGQASCPAGCPPLHPSSRGLRHLGAAARGKQAPSLPARDDGGSATTALSSHPVAARSQPSLAHATLGVHPSSSQCIPARPGGVCRAASCRSVHDLALHVSGGTLRPCSSLHFICGSARITAAASPRVPGAQSMLRRCKAPGSQGQQATSPPQRLCSSRPVPLCLSTCPGALLLLEGLLPAGEDTELLLLLMEGFFPTVVALWVVFPCCSQGQAALRWEPHCSEAGMSPGLGLLLPQTLQECRVLAQPRGVRATPQCRSIPRTRSKAEDVDRASLLSWLGLAQTSHSALKPGGFKHQASPLRTLLSVCRTCVPAAGGQAARGCLPCVVLRALAPCVHTHTHASSKHAHPCACAARDADNTAI